MIDLQILHAERLQSHTNPGIGCKQVKAGAARVRQQRLTTAAVVGVTCCSAALPALDGATFEVVVLDEASQMIEPLSLLPLVRAGCRHVTFTTISNVPAGECPLQRDAELTVKCVGFLK